MPRIVYSPSGVLEPQPCVLVLCPLCVCLCVRVCVWVGGSLPVPLGPAVLKTVRTGQGLGSEAGLEARRGQCTDQGTGEEKLVRGEWREWGRGSGEEGQGSWAENWAASTCSPPVSLHPGASLCSEFPVAPSLVVSSLEHCFTPSKHLLYALHSPRTPLLPSLSGSQAPTSSIPRHHHPETPIHSRSHVPALWAIFYTIPSFFASSSLPVCADLPPTHTPPPLHPPSSKAFPFIPSQSLILNHPAFSRNVFSPSPRLPVVQSSSFCLSVRVKEAGKIPGFSEF